MNYFNHNLECLRERHNNLYLKLQDSHQIEGNIQVDLVESRSAVDGELFIMVQKDNKSYRLNSSYNPTHEANIWSEQYQFHNLNNVISMYGFGNGYFARSVVERLGDKDILLIYEPSIEIFQHVMQYYDISDIISDTRVIIAIEGLNEFEYHHVIQNVIGINNIRNQTIITHPKYDKMFTESSILFWKEIKDTYTHANLNIATAVAFGQCYIDNILDNIKSLNNSNTIVELGKVLQKDVPAVVIAAGPSVEQQIEELKKMKGKAVLFAVDRIIDYLLDAGIEPDFLVTLDPIKPVELFSRRKNLTIPLLCFMASNHEVLEAHIGRKIICNCSEYLENLYKDNSVKPPMMIASASVATVAFTACVELGFKTIILVGQDLAYDGAKTHVGGVQENCDTGEDVLVEGIDGQMVKSRYDWKEFITWYQDFMTLYPEINVIDAKDHGARIKGTKSMSLKEAMKEYCKNDFYYNLEELEPTFQGMDLQPVKKYLQESLETLNKIRPKSKDAVNICYNLIRESKRNIASAKIDSNLKKLSRINDYVLEQNIYKLMNYYVSAKAAQQLSQLYQFTDQHEEDSINTYERTKYVFEAMNEVTDYMKTKIEKIIENLC